MLRGIVYFLLGGSPPQNQQRSDETDAWYRSHRRRTYLRWCRLHWRWTVLLPLTIVLSALGTSPLLAFGSSVVICFAIPALLGRYRTADEPTTAMSPAETAFVAHLQTRWNEDAEAAGLTLKHSVLHGVGVDEAYRQSVGAAQHRLNSLAFGNPDALQLPQLLAVHRSTAVVGLDVFVQMLPGQDLDTYRKALPYLRHIWAVHEVRTRCEEPGVAIISVAFFDPIAGVIEAPAPPTDMMSANDPVLIAISETGTEIRRSVAAEATHEIRQGQTRSGKTQAAYLELQQLATMPDVIIAGCDHTQVLLYPFRNTRHREFISLGPDMQAHADNLVRLVQLMDERIATLGPRYIDKLSEFSPAEPVVVVYLEEYPGLLKAAGNWTRVQRAEGNKEAMADAIIAECASRIGAEGAKAGFRLRIITQRADANIIGGYERSNYAVGLTLRVNDSSAVNMLHEGIDAEQFGDPKSWPPGVGIYQAPGILPCKVRVPYVGDYGPWARQVEQICRYVDAAAAVGFQPVPIHPVPTHLALDATSSAVAEPDLEVASSTPRDPIADILEIADLEAALGRRSAEAFQRAAASLSGLTADEISQRALDGTLHDLPGLGNVTVQCILESLEGYEPQRLAALRESLRNLSNPSEGAGL